MKKLSVLILASILAFTSCTKDDSTDSSPAVPLKRVEVNGTVSTNTIWTADNVYIVTGSITIGNNATLTIEPGTSVKFNSNMEIDVASSGFGTIKALGTAEKPILFTSNATNKTKGDWFGFWLYEGSNGCEFAYCTFEYGAGYSETQGVMNLRSDVEASFDHCTFKNNNGYGIQLNSSASFSSFNYNNFSDNTNKGVDIYANYVSTMGINNTYDSEILVEGDHVVENGDVNWKNQGTTLLVNDDIEVGSTSGTKLIIEAGIRLAFMKNAELGVAYASNTTGLIVANGTTEKPIVFTSASNYPGKGDWDGIWFYTNTANGNSFDHCVIEYGGGYSDDGNFIFKSGVSEKVSISNSIIRYSKGYGLYKSSGSDNTVPVLTNITYTDNTLGDKNWQ